MSQTLLIVVAALVAFDLVMRAYFVRKILKIFETKPPFSVPIYPPHPEAEIVETVSTSGLVLRGSLTRAAEQPARGLILFFPELEGTHWSALSYAESLVEAGYDLLSFDFRNQGESDADDEYYPLHWPTMYEIEDARAAMKFIRSREDLASLPLGVMGVSRGSQAALVIAAEHPDVQAVCCEGAYSTRRLMMYFTQRWAFLYLPDWAMKLTPVWHFELTLWLVRCVSEWHRRCRYAIAERWLPRLRARPVLLIAGERDNYVHPEISLGIKGDVGESAEVWIAPRAKHNRAREADQIEYDRRLVEFFQEHLKPAANERAVMLAAGENA